MRRLRAPLAASFVLILLLNGLIAIWSRRLPYMLLLSTIPASNHPNLVLVGNSLLDHHFNASLFGQSSQKNGVLFHPLNVALGATDPPEHQLLFDYAIRVHPELRTLVVGIYDFQLTESDRSKPTDLTGNRMLGLSKVIPVSDVESAYQFDKMDMIQVRLLRIIPMASNRASVWKYVELLRRRMETVGMPPEATNSMGRVSDFAALEASSVQNFDLRAQQFLLHPRTFNTNYEAIFSEASNRGMRSFIVVMPASPSHRARFYSRTTWGQYLAGVSRYATERGIEIIDASQWTPSEDDFVDNLHMSDKGVTLFSERLGNELSQRAVDFGSSR